MLEAFPGVADRSPNLASMSNLPPPARIASAAPASLRLTAVTNAATAWSGQLIDLGGRNTLLYYRDLRAGTLDLTAAAPGALAGLLDGRTTRLSALFPGDALAEAARRARTVAAKGRENFEERGLSTLYVACGMATWDPQGTTVATPAAPVLLAQMSLKPVGALEADFELAVTDEWEPNPTLLHLLRTSYEVEVHADDLLTAIDSAGGRLEAAGEALASAVGDLRGFAVSARTVAGNFSYAKQPMVLDLESAVDVMAANDLIAALAGDRDAIATLRDAQIGVGLDEPDRIPPAEEFLAIDADASQHFVINAAVHGGNLVVQGPPGTGKSQTIANLIAALSARGRSVLFVAEKRAAIDAVVNRLNRAGLGDLVLDLYGGGGSRRKMAAELRRVYDGTATVPPVHREGDNARLVDLRTRLNRHAAALHAPRAPWQVSVYELQARLTGVPSALHAPMRIAAGPLAGVELAALRRVADALADWVTTGGPAVERRATPWAHAATTVTDGATAEAALTTARTLANETLPAAARQLDAAVAATGLRRPATVAMWAETLGLLHQVAGVQSRLQPTIWTMDLASLAADMQPATAGGFGRFVAGLFNGRFRSARKQLATLAVQPCTPQDLHATVALAGTARATWIAQRTDGGGPRLPADLAGASAAYERFSSELGTLGGYLGSSLVGSDLLGTAHILDALLADANTLYRLPKLHELTTVIDGNGFGAVRRFAAERDLDPAAGRQLVEYAWCASVLEQIQLADPDIGAFDGSTHSGYVAEFGHADRNQISAGAAKVRRAVAEHLVEVRNAHPDADALVAAEVRKKTRHRTLRELTQMAPEVLLALKPCWAMSPLAVSQLLDATPLFDVVIFDEASQVPPADAIPALMRARQAIVAGDSKQLPPTAFFASTATDDTDASAAGNLTVGTESVLDAMANIITAGSMTLRWHYRSRDERLIAFSNAQSSLYDWQMVTFPGTTGTDAIRHIHVPWTAEGVNAGDPGASPTAEVQRVVALVADHARTHPERSLGVIAMGIEHAERINEMLRRARHEDAVVDDWCNSRHPDEPLFVKNLERVQGDERDAIILSVGYGKNANGVMQYRFGPINAEGGERRLNVAVTRARSQMTVVSSFLPTDLDPQKLRSEGAQMLGRYIAYAASGGGDLGPVRREHPPLNPLEADIRDRLQAAGVPLTAQLGVSGYYIDLAARHPHRPGRYVLAIEADGASYHASATARERDRLRQEHLERLGWRFHRIWSTDWFRDRESEIITAVAAWQAACSATDAADAAAPQPAIPATVTAWAAPVMAALSLAPPVCTDARRSVARPRLEPGQPIGEYTDTELVAIVRWVASDGLLRTDGELHTEVREEMGFQRRGTVIVERLHQAIAEFRRRDDA